MKGCFPATALLGFLIAAPPLCASGGPPADAPPDFVEAWLRFHEQQLCESIDAVFVFRPDLLEVWMVVEEEKHYEKLGGLLAELHAAGRAQIYATRMPPEPKSASERMPPPGLWNNGELRSSLLDPFPESRLTIRGPVEEGLVTGDRFYRQRLIAFADQTLEWNRNLRRDAEDLPALVGLAYGTTADSRLRVRAAAVCKAHIREVDRNADRLIGNLTLATPRGDRRDSDRAGQEPPTASSTRPIPEIVRLATLAGSVSQRVLRFVYPRAHTVTLDDLREPDLLLTLKSLRSLAAGALDRMNSSSAGN